MPSDLYSALIGAPVDSAEKQAALADLLRRKAGFAQVAQMTGDPTLAPMGQNQSQQAMQQAQALQRGAFQQQDSQQAQQNFQLQQQQEARQAAGQQQQLALTKRGQDLDYDASMSGIASRAELAEAKAALTGAKQPTEGERKNAALATRLEGAMRELEGLPADAQKPRLLEKALSAMGQETMANVSRSPNRQRADTAQLDALDAALTLGTGASYTKEQLEGQRKAYFPQIGDDKTTVDKKAQRLAALVKSARSAAGRAAGSIDTALGEPAPKAAARTIKRTGKHGGRKVVEYSDGTVEYAD